MQAMGIGAGLAAVAFWGFVAVCVWAGIWDAIRKREAQHETLRRMIESGQPIDPDLVDRILGGTQELDHNLKVGGLICLFLAPGVALMGWIISLQSPPVLLPLLGAGAVLLFVAAGLLVASKAVAAANRKRGL